MQIFKLWEHVAKPFSFLLKYTFCKKEMAFADKFHKYFYNYFTPHFSNTMLYAVLFYSVSCKYAGVGEGNLFFFWRRGKEGREKLFCRLGFWWGWSGLQMCFYHCGGLGPKFYKCILKNINLHRTNIKLQRKNWTPHCANINLHRSNIILHRSNIKLQSKNITPHQANIKPHRKKIKLHH